MLANGNNIGIDVVEMLVEKPSFTNIFVEGNLSFPLMISYLNAKDVAALRDTCKSFRKISTAGYMHVRDVLTQGNLEINDITPTLNAELASIAAARPDIRKKIIARTGFNKIQAAEDRLTNLSASAPFFSEAINSKIKTNTRLYCLAGSKGITSSMCMVLVGIIVFAVGANKNNTLVGVGIGIAIGGILLLCLGIAAKEKLKKRGSKYVGKLDQEEALLSEGLRSAHLVPGAF